MIAPPTFSQLNPLWASKPLGTSGRTVGSDGCLDTCLAMALANYAIQETPATVVDKLNAVGGIFPSGDTSWQAIQQAWPQVTFIFRWDTTNYPVGKHQKLDAQAAVRKVAQLIRLGQCVPLNVKTSPSLALPNHFVLAYDVNSAGTDFKIKDPNGGVDAYFSQRFGDPMTQIYGLGALAGTPVEYPDSGYPWAGTALGKAGMVSRGVNVGTYSGEILNDLTAG